MDENVLEVKLGSVDKGLLEEVAAAIRETLSRFDLGVNADVAHGESWHLVIDDGWGQHGGWMQEIDGRFAYRRHGPPDEKVVRDVWAALERARSKPEREWDQGWGPLPTPKPGPDPRPRIR